MILHLCDTVRLSRVTSVLTALDADVNPSKLLLYTEPMPDPGDAITTQTLIATIILADPAGTIDDEAMELTFGAVTPVLATHDGDLAWGRFTDGDNNWVMDGDAGETGDDKFIIIDNKTIYAGGMVTVTLGTLTEPV